MNYLIAAADRFERVDDPFKLGRICFKSTHAFYERLDLVRISEDPTFLFIHDMIIYFKG